MAQQRGKMLCRPLSDPAITRPELWPTPPRIMVIADLARDKAMLRAMDVCKSNPDRGATSGDQ